MYTEVTGIVKALEVARNFLDSGMNVTISKLRNGRYAIKTVGN